jgi:cbb3-type cytochrome oxidase subunit 3
MVKIWPMKNIKVFAAILILSNMFMGLTAHAYHEYYYRPEWNPVTYNSAPRWNAETVKYAHVGQNMTFTVSANDVDGDRLSYYGMFLPIGARFDSHSRTFTWTPRKTGTYDLQFRVYDGGYSHSDLYVTVVVGNRLPEFNNITPVDYDYPTHNPTNPSSTYLNFVNFNPVSTATENQLYTYTVQTNSSHKVIYSLPRAPQGMTINPDLGIIIWLPNQNQAQLAPYLVTVKATNGYQDIQLNYNLTVGEGGTITPQPKPDPTPQPTPGPVVPDEPADDQDEVETDEDKTGFLASIFIAGIDFLFSPWFLLFLIFLLLILLFLCKRKGKGEKQLIAFMEERDKMEDKELEE